ncbi:MAG: hypothetical protein K2N85_02465 [Lachnospiraceae bacterium]|nr:hypothetical protein [Lachnospiraceae bacterium]
MKKYLSIILAAFIAVCALTGFVRQSNTHNTGIPIRKSEPSDMPDDSFCDEEYQKLSALKFNNYEDMTISDFQNQVWKLTDTTEYRDLLERFSKSETLYDLKDTDETAAFLFYVLEPLTAEKWESRDYSGYTASEFPHPADNAALEYSFTISILNADMLTVREYNTTRLSIINGMRDILSDKTEEELRDESSMLITIQTDTDNLIRQLQTEEIGISIEYAYFPLSAQNDNNGNEQPQISDEQETRRYSNGTEEDYRSLLSLKTTDYQNMPLVDFNNALLVWANENHERMERISEDIGWNDFQVPLNNEELSFVKLTVFLSGMENGKAIQSIYTGTKPDSPYYAKDLQQKTTNKNGTAWCSLYYRFSYSISDTETITVGERDRRIQGMINAIQSFWDDTDIESMLKMSEGDVVKELEKIAEIYSSNNIKITTSGEQVHFECMDERNYAN